ncbi:RNA methyltransferase [Oceanobacter sp. 5_MG-2023]|uniref:RNA methyltransferase n=1 Tax=unclassified Oceanobacter TaxID=2620260 RepID=UPI0034C623E7
MISDAGDHYPLLDAIDIVMVNTTHSGNIGAAARAMKNMGLGQLILVDPIATVNDEALARSSRAEDILQRVRIVPTLEEAIADASLVVGTSARSRHIPWPLMTPRQAAESVCQVTGTGARAALVFGRESRGLTNEELHLCHAHVHIPTVESFSSLNVAQAVQVLCYEMRLAAIAAADNHADNTAAVMGQRWGVEWDHPPATHKELNGMMLHLEQTLVDIGFLDPNTPKQLMTRLRRLYQRAEPDKMEINMVRGMLAAIQQHAGRRQDQPVTDVSFSPQTPPRSDAQLPMDDAIDGATQGSHSDV